MFSRSPGSHCGTLIRSWPFLRVLVLHFPLRSTILLWQHMHCSDIMCHDSVPVQLRTRLQLWRQWCFLATYKVWRLAASFLITTGSCQTLLTYSELINIVKARGFRNGPSKCRAFILSPRRRMKSQKKERQSYGIIHWLLAQHQSENTNQLCALSGDWSLRCSSLCSEIWGLSLPCRVYTHWCMGT